METKSPPEKPGAHMLCPLLSLRERMQSSKEKARADNRPLLLCFVSRLEISGKQKLEKK